MPGANRDRARQDLVAFAAMVQKELIRKDEEAASKARLELDKLDRMSHRLKLPRKP